MAGSMLWQRSGRRAGPLALPLLVLLVLLLRPMPVSGGAEEFSPAASANTTDLHMQTFALAERLLAFGDMEGAALEYRRFLGERPPDSLAFRAWDRLAGALAGYGASEAANNAWRNAQRTASNLSDAERALFSRALLLMAARAYASASLLFLELKSTTQDSLMICRAGYFEGLCALEQAQWRNARMSLGRALSDPHSGARTQVTARLDSLLLEAMQMPRRSPTAAQWLSTFLPGAGQMYAGSFWSGANALALNLLNGYLLVRSSQRREWDEVGLNSVLLLSRYYQGNRYQAGLRAERSNADRQERFRSEAVRLASEAVGSAEKEDEK